MPKSVSEHPRPPTALGSALVTGASGFVGSRLVRPLIDRGWNVSVLTRETASVATQEWFPLIKAKTGDATNPSNIRKALEGCSVAFYLLHSLEGPRDFCMTELQLARTFARAARASGAKRIIYLGGYSPRRLNSPHLSSRAAVGDVLLNSEVNTIALQAGPIIGLGSASFELMNYAAKLPVTPAGPALSAAVQPISIRDVIHFLIEAAEHPKETNSAVEIGGPEIMSYAECITRIRNQMGLAAPRPLWLTPSVLSSFDELISRQTGLNKNLVSALLQGLGQDAIATHMNPLVLPLPPHGLQSFNDAVKAALDEKKGTTRQASSRVLHLSPTTPKRPHPRPSHKRATASRHPPIALVLGGSSGIGATMTVAFQKLGFVVACAARWTQQPPPANISTARYFRGDATCLDEVSQLVNEIEESLGPISVALVTAGDLAPLPFPQESTQTVEMSIRRNVFPFVNTARVLCPLMIERGRGSISCISSGWSLIPTAQVASYAAAKAALTAYAQSMSDALAGTGVSAHVIYPGYYPDTFLASRARATGLREPIRFLRTSDRGLQRIASRLATGKASPVLHANFLERIAPAIPIISPRILRSISTLIRPFPNETETFATETKGKNSGNH